MPNPSPHQQGVASDGCVLQVEFDSAVVGARDVLGVVRGMGYGATLLQADELSAGMGEREKEKRFWRAKVLTGQSFNNTTQNKKWGE